MKKIPFVIILITIVSSLALPVIAQAANHGNLVAQVQMQQDLKPQFAAELNTPGGSSRAGAGNLILQLIAGSLIYAAGPLAVLMIAVGGFRYVISHGEQTQMEGAKKTIMWAIIGLMIIIVSYAIVRNVITISQNAGEPPKATTTGSGSGQQGEAAPPPKAPDTNPGNTGGNSG